MKQGRQLEGLGKWEDQPTNLLGNNISPYHSPPYSEEQEIQLEECKATLDWYQHLYISGFHGLSNIVLLL